MKEPMLHSMGMAVAIALFAGLLRAEPKPLNRSLFMPVEFVLCEHLEDAILFQDGQPVSTMPAKRVFQFTYYPNLERMLPEVVQVRVEGTYVQGGDAFVAKLAMTPDGIHTAHRTRGLNTMETVRKQRHKIDVRLEPRTIQLRCERYCTKSTTVASTAQ